MKNKIITLILFTGLAFVNLYSQNLNTTRIDSLFDILAEKNKAMGSLTISKNGNVLYSRAIGYSFISEKEKIASTQKTKYRIGSISKMFTAAMIFQLIEEGKLSLATTLDIFFPKLPNAKKITISNLLNHRSGLHNFTDDKEYETWMTQPKTQAEMLEKISKHKVDFKPNKKASYSNSNYVVLGYIIEKVSNKPYAQNLNERITSKIGLSDTYYGNKTNINDNESFSYQFLNNWKQQPETDMSIPAGAGAIIATPTDLVKFIEALFSLKIISKNSLLQMKTINDDYGMGMFEFPFYTNTKKAYGHTGAIDGFASALFCFPEDSLAIAYCSNGEEYPLNSVIKGVCRICFNKEYVIPTFKTISLKSEDLDKYLGVYTSKQISLKITITKDSTTLFAQAKGQSAFPLESIEKDKFGFLPDGIEIEFNTEKDEFTLIQSGERFLYTKVK